MDIKAHKLILPDGTPAEFEKTVNQGKKLAGNKPIYVVIHYTASGTARSTIRWFKDPAADVSAHLVIDHDGSITQMVRFDEKAWHAGRSSWDGNNGLNRYSIGIELVNWGKLQGNWGGWKSWTGVTVPDDRVIEAAHKHRPGRREGWEIFDESQIDICVQAVRAIVRTYNIDELNVVGHDDISPNRKSDPGPAWDMARFTARVSGRKSDRAAEMLFKVNAPSGLNMRRGPSISQEKIKTLNTGTTVSLIEKHDLWWLVAEIVAGKENDTGWVYSRWLVES